MFVTDKNTMLKKKGREKKNSQTLKQEFLFVVKIFIEFIKQVTKDLKEIVSADYNENLFLPLFSVGILKG